MARKSVAEGLRKGLQREDRALDARFAVADSAMAQLKAAATATEPQPPVTPEGAKFSGKSAKRASSKSTKSAADGAVVRESFSMPSDERDTLDRLILTLRKRGVYEVTRSQLLRAGIAKLAALEGPELEEAILSVERGRPRRKPSDLSNA
jgi:hypothetical protein